MTRPRRRLSSVAALGLALFSALLACGPPEAQRPLASNPLGGGDVASPVNLVESPGHPVIATLVREGDPVSVLSLALSADGDPVALLALAEIAAARLADAGVAAETRVDRDALFLDVALEGDPKAAALALRKALETPIAPSPAVAARVSERVADIPSESGPAVSAVRSCSGAIGAAKPMPIDPASVAGAQRIEKLRKAAFTLETAAFGVVGPEASVRAAVDALLDGGTWPATAPAAGNPWLLPVGGASIAPDVASGTLRLSVSIQANDPAAAIASAARLGRSPSSLSAQAERGGFRLTRLYGVARPRGGCVTAVFEGKVPSSAEGEGRAIADAALQLSRAFTREVRAELAMGAGPLEAARRIESAADPRDAARLAAWWALSRPIDGPAPEGRGIAAALELGSDQSETARASIEKLLGAGLFDARSRGLPEAAKVHGRLERGQAETWVLVANPCAVASEAPHRWGAAALAALSASQKAQAAARAIDPSITIEPFVSPRGVGFLARAARREGKDPALLARDLATAATQAFFVAPPSADEVLTAEGVALERLRQSFGTAGPGLAELGAKMGEHPSALEPLGLPLRLGRFDPLDLGRRLRATADGPLVVTLLAEADVAKEGAAAGEAVLRFGSANGPSCPTIPAPTAGRSEVREPRKGPSRVYWLFRAEPSPKARAFSSAVVSLLSSQQQPGLRARVIEGHAEISLLVDVTSADADLGRAEKATADLLQKLSAGGFDDAALTRALSDEVRAEQRALFDPRERLARLSTGDSAEPHGALQPAELREWIKRTVRVERAAVVVSRPE